MPRALHFIAQCLVIVSTVRSLGLPSLPGIVWMVLGPVPALIVLMTPSALPLIALLALLALLLALSEETAAAAAVAVAVAVAVVLLVVGLEERVLALPALLAMARCWCWSGTIWLHVKQRSMESLSIPPCTSSTTKSTMSCFDVWAPDSASNWVHTHA
jgi:hypothetical protein